MRNEQQFKPVKTTLGVTGRSRTHNQPQSKTDNESPYSALEISKIDPSLNRAAWKAQKECSICNVGLGAGTEKQFKKQYCRFCYRAVCEKCSPLTAHHPESLKEERICKRCYDTNLEKRFNAGRNLIDYKPEISPTSKLVPTRLNPDRKEILNVRPISPLTLSHGPITPTRRLPTPLDTKPKMHLEPNPTPQPPRNDLPKFGGGAGNSVNRDIDSSKEVDPMIADIMQQIKDQEEENRLLRKRLDLLNSRSAPPAKASGCGCSIF